MLFSSLLSSDAREGKGVVAGRKRSLIAVARLATLGAVLLPGLVLGSLSAATTFGQGQQKQAQTDQSASQRFSIMRSKLEAMRKSLNNAIAAIPAKEASD